MFSQRALYTVSGVSESLLFSAPYLKMSVSRLFSTVILENWVSQNII